MKKTLTALLKFFGKAIVLLLIVFLLPILILLGSEVYHSIHTSFYSEEESWVQDIHKLKSALIEKHPNPNWSDDLATYRIEQKAEELVNWVVDKKGKVDRDIMRVELMKMSAFLNDGHTRIFNYKEEVGALPVGAEWFADEFYITKADSSVANLLGQKVVAVNGISLPNVLEKLSEICPHGQESELKMYSEFYFFRPGLLYGLGISDHPRKATLTLEDRTGRRSEVRLDASAPTKGLILAESDGLYEKQKGKRYWFEYQSVNELLYLRYRSVFSISGNPMESFVDSLMVVADSKKIRKFIIDLRGNSGGDNFLTVKLISEIMKRPKLNQRGVLYVITNHQTFSAAISLLGNLMVKTKATQVGVPAGDFNNSPADSKFINLRKTDFTWTVSELFWENTLYDDYKVSFQPSINGALTFAEWKEGKTPLINQILNDTLSASTFSLPDSLNNYSGRYQFSPDRTLHLNLTEGELFISGFIQSDLTFSADSILIAKNLGFSLQLKDDKLFLLKEGNTPRELKRLDSDKFTALELLLNGNYEAGRKAYAKLVQQPGEKPASIEMNNLCALSAYAYQITGNNELRRHLLKVALSVNDKHTMVHTQMGNTKIAAREYFTGYTNYALAIYYFDWANILNYGKMVGIL